MARMESRTDSKDAWLTALYVVLGVAAIVLVLWLFRKWRQGRQFKKEFRIDGKVVIVTGANTGIGKETALELASRGAKVYMACRDHSRCEAARLEIVEKTGNSNVFNRSLDLSSLESVRSFVSEFLKEETRLDILVNNAGVMVCPKSYTQDGFETQFGVNHLGHFLLTMLLLDLLKKSAPSRIVNVSSLAYLFGTIKKDDLMSEKSYHRWSVYGQSKLANILFTKELARRLEGTQVVVNALHPGVVNTELTRYIPKFLNFINKPFAWLFYKTAKSGAQTQIRLALDPELEGVTGKFFVNSREAKVVAKAEDMETARWLWQKSEELVGLGKS